MANDVCGTDLERFDHSRDVCREGMEREPFERATAAAGAARIHRDRAKAIAAEALGEVVEIAHVEAAGRQQHDGIAGSCSAELNRRVADANHAHVRTPWRTALATSTCNQAETRQA